MNYYVIGIDPGRNGGITALYKDKIVSIEKLPPDPEELYNHLLYLGLPTNYMGELVIGIENVHAMPRDGSRQAFTFGKGLGQLEGVLASLGLLGVVARISPHKWMKYYNIIKERDETKTSFKNRLKNKAIELSHRKLTLATCDSFLIANYLNDIYKLNKESNGSKKSKSTFKFNNKAKQQS